MQSDMKFPGVLALIAVVLLMPACASLSKIFHPKWTPEENEMLKFNVDRIKLGSKPKELKQFPQVKEVKGKKENELIYEVFNPNSHISLMILWYEGKPKKQTLKQIELRYFHGSGVETLTISGGWQGIRDYMIQYYGPPSMFGPDVPVVATQAGLDPKTAVFNGAWNFSRINRRLNYIANVTEKGGVAVVTAMDTTEPKKTSKEKKEAKAAPTPNPDSINPGF